MDFPMRYINWFCLSHLSAGHQGIIWGLELGRIQKNQDSVMHQPSSNAADDISEGTPNRNKAAASEERHGTSDNMDVNSEEKGHHKPQDDISDGTPNTNNAAFSEERHGTSDKMDVSSEEKGHYIPQDGSCIDSSLEGLSLSAGRTRDRLSSKMKSKLKGDPKSVKPVEYEENRLACRSSDENNMRNAAICGKRTSGRRSTSIPSAVGLQPTDCETVDGNIARQAGKQSKNTSKTLRSCVGLSDANQIDDLKIAGSKKETNVKDARKSREKTERKLTYESPVTKRGIERQPLCLQNVRVSKDLDQVL